MAKDKKLPYENDTPEYQLWMIINSQKSLIVYAHEDLIKAQEKATNVGLKLQAYQEALKKLDPNYQDSK
jgi:hypothetical protein